MVRMSKCVKGHSHHWKYPPPDGPTSIATCKRCGGTKESANSYQRTPWQSLPESPRNFSPVKERVLSLARQGLDPKDIADKTGVAINTVYFHMRKAGIKPPKKAMHERQRRHAQALFGIGYSYKEIADEVGITYNLAKHYCSRKYVND